MFDNLAFFTICIYKQVLGCFQLFILACARALAGQSEHDSECLNKAVIAYTSNYIYKKSFWTSQSGSN